MKTISRNPATGETIGEVPLTSQEEAIAILKRREVRRKMYEGIVAIIDSLYDTSLWARLRALPKMVRIFLRYFSHK